MLSAILTRVSADTLVRSPPVLFVKARLNIFAVHIVFFIMFDLERVFKYSSQV